MVSINGLSDQQKISEPGIVTYTTTEWYASDRRALVKQLSAYAKRVQFLVLIVASGRLLMYD